MPGKQVSDEVVTASLTKATISPSRKKQEGKEFLESTPGVSGGSAEEAEGSVAGDPVGRILHNHGWLLSTGSKVTSDLPSQVNYR